MSFTNCVKFYRITLKLKYLSVDFLQSSMNLKTFFLHCPIFWLIVQRFAMGKMEVILDEKIDNCTKGQGGALDFSNFELIAESDTMIFANGSVKFLKTAADPFKNHAYTEKYERGQWNLQVLDKKYPDFCKTKDVPTEQAYKFFVDCPKCPFQAGASFNFLKTIRAFSLSL